MENIYETAMRILNDNITIRKKQLKQKIQKNHNENKPTKEEKALIDKAYDDFNKVALKYNKSKSLTKITEISPILRELISTKDLDFDDGIVLLTKDNAANIEKAIKEDDDYYPFFERIFGSFNFSDIRHDEGKALFACIREIDRDNSTNVWRYGDRASIHKIIEYIKNPQNNFWDKLKTGEPRLPDELVEVGGTGIKSLSTKICKYLSNEASKIDKEYAHDCYYINDRIVKGVLLFYLDHYGVKHEKIKTANKLKNIKYIDFFNLLEKLNEAAEKKHGTKLSRNELDHILWYCYKSFKIY